MDRSVINLEQNNTLFTLGVPFGSGSPLYLFCLYKKKKDAAAIPNAALEHLLKQRNLEEKKKAQNMSFFYNLNS